MDPRELGAQCDSCPLSKSTPVAPAPAKDGKLRLVVVGENPGRYDERLGLPFQGPQRAGVVG